MDTEKVAEQNRDSGRKNNKLDDLYGRIGISAVAAALRYRSKRRDAPEQRNRSERQETPRVLHYEFD